MYDIDLVSAALQPGIAKGAIKVSNPNAIKEKTLLVNPDLANVNFNDLYDITDAIGKYDFKNRQNFPVRVLKDAKTGKVYITTKTYTSAAGNQVVPMGDKSTFTTAPNVLQEIDPKCNFMLKNYLLFFLW